MHRLSWETCQNHICSECKHNIIDEDVCTKCISFSSMDCYFEEKPSVLNGEGSNFDEND